ncbi:hypothetical protein [Flaviflagellibacter deserti]|jgi:hypothetical protein|uniref:Uncharacterized protein n=1 Tax=Flaviflagellibacter deserti TaxID=2267266 RepID=A0ABV9YUT9_9HYPH
MRFRLGAQLFMAATLVAAMLLAAFCIFLLYQGEPAFKAAATISLSILVAAQIVLSGAVYAWSIVRQQREVTEIAGALAVAQFAEAIHTRRGEIISDPIIEQAVLGAPADLLAAFFRLRDRVKISDFNDEIQETALALARDAKVFAYRRPQTEWLTRTY